MVELFDLIKDQHTTLRIRAERVPYFSSDKPNQLISLLDSIKDCYHYEIFNIDYGLVFNEEYVKSFDIEIELPHDLYSQLNKQYKHILTKYEKDIINRAEISQMAQQLYYEIGDTNANV